MGILTVVVGVSESETPTTIYDTLSGNEYIDIVTNLFAQVLIFCLTSCFFTVDSGWSKGRCWPPTPRAPAGDAVAASFVAHDMSMTLNYTQYGL